MKDIVKFGIVLVLVIPLSGCFKHVNIPNIANMMHNLQQNLQPVWQMLVAVSYIAGVSFIVRGVFRLKKYGDMRTMMSNHATVVPTLTYFFVGSMMMWLKPAVDVLVRSFWGYGVNNIKGYVTTGSYEWTTIVSTGLTLIQVLGLVAFIRGWMLISRLGSERSQAGGATKGVLHLVGGILAINIYGTLRMLEGTLGI